MRLRSLIMALLLIPLLATAAGAIYIEGADAPVYADDEIHIMAAADTPLPEGIEDAIMPASMGGDSGLYVPLVNTAAIPGGLDTPVAYDVGPIKKYLSNDPDDYVLLPGNEPGMVYALGETLAVPPYTIPALNSPAAISYAIPAMAWNGPANVGLNFNMPVLSFPVFN